LLFCECIVNGNEFKESLLCDLRLHPIKGGILVNICGDFIKEILKLIIEFEFEDIILESAVQFNMIYQIN
jgi:hypothetical protein